LALAHPHARPHHRRGVALTLLSAVAFAATGVLAKGAYAAGAGVATVLGARFALAALALWALVAWRARRGALRLPPAPVALGALALGAVGYAGEATLYFSALERLDASLVALLLASYPAIVVVLAVVGGREAASRRRTVALAASIAGAALVLGGARVSGLDAAGLALAAAATVAYATYVLLADGFTRRMDGLVLATLVVSGAALGTLAGGAASGSLQATLPAGAWAAIAALALVCTVVPIAAFLLALPHVGPGTASILSTFETVVAVGLAAVLLGEALGPAQVAGAALVLGAAVLLNLPARVGADAAASPAAAAAARPLVVVPADGAGALGLRAEVGRLPGAGVRGRLDDRAALTQRPAAVSVFP
jgi:drug/metabolite transporter (DMT)-like permease